jgi:ADP-heptose:LPS heptosyltransferase
MHIGAAFGKKIISIWGNTVPEFGMYPYRANPASIQFEVDGLKCRPCSKIGHQACPKKHFKCMLNQDLDGIALKAEGLFYSN